MKPFVALDVETASRRDNGSICQLSIVKYDGRTLSTAFSSLINPLCDFDPFCVGIHGIDKEAVVDAPAFGQVEDVIRPLLEGNIVVAHNASFDISAINKAAIREGIDNFSIMHGCTLCAARTLLYGELKSYSLPNVCKALSIDLVSHHDSEADATACALIAIKLCELANADSIPGLMERSGHIIKRAMKPSKAKAPKNLISPLFKSDYCESFDGKYVVITGELTTMFRKDAEHLIEDLGGTIQSGVTKETDVLVVGRYDLTKFNRENRSSKHIKAEAMKAKGHKIIIINEDEFVRLIGER